MERVVSQEYTIVILIKLAFSVWLFNLSAPSSESSTTLAFLRRFYVVDVVSQR